MDLNVQLSCKIYIIMLLPDQCSEADQTKDKWVYVAMLSILGGMVFHIFWEANPKYSICFMGMMTFVMLFGIESIRQFDFKESGLLQKKYTSLSDHCRRNFMFAADV